MCGKRDCIKNEIFLLLWTSIFGYGQMVKQFCHWKLLLDVLQVVYLNFKLNPTIFLNLYVFEDPFKFFSLQLRITLVPANELFFRIF